MWKVFGVTIAIVVVSCSHPTLGSDGATSELKSISVVPSPPLPHLDPVQYDTFERTNLQSWGSMPSGGAYVGPTNIAVDQASTTGRITLTNASPANIYLPRADAHGLLDTAVYFRYRFDVLPRNTSDVFSVGVQSRLRGNSSQYYHFFVQDRWKPSAATGETYTTIRVYRKASTNDFRELTVGSEILFTDLERLQGKYRWLRIDTDSVTSTRTRLSVKLWMDGDQEPQQPQWSFFDDNIDNNGSPALGPLDLTQDQGQLMLFSKKEGTLASVVAQFDDLSVYSYSKGESAQKGLNWNWSPWWNLTGENNYPDLALESDLVEISQTGSRYVRFMMSPNNTQNNFSFFRGVILPKLKKYNLSPLITISVPKRPGDLSEQQKAAYEAWLHSIAGFLAVHSTKDGFPAVSLIEVGNEPNLSQFFVTHTGISGQ